MGGDGKGDIENISVLLFCAPCLEKLMVMY